MNTTNESAAPPASTQNVADVTPVFNTAKSETTRDDPEMDPRVTTTSLASNPVTTDSQVTVMSVTPPSVTPTRRGTPPLTAVMTALGKKDAVVFAAACGAAPNIHSSSHAAGSSTKVSASVLSRVCPIT